MDYSRIDTTPGTRTVLAPPFGWHGTEAEYGALMKERYEAYHNPLVASAWAAYRHPIEVTGPYARAGAVVLRRTLKRHKARTWRAQPITAKEEAE